MKYAEVIFWILIAALCFIGGIRIHMCMTWALKGAGFIAIIAAINAYKYAKKYS